MPDIPVGVFRIVGEVCALNPGKIAGAPKVRAFLVEASNVQGRGSDRSKAFLLSRNHYFWGSGQIKGTVAYANRPADIPLVRRVRLFEMRSGLLVGETWSDENGNYRFDRLNPNYEYLAVADDHERAWEGVVADYVTPTVVAYP